MARKIAWFLIVGSPGDLERRSNDTNPIKSKLNPDQNCGSLFVISMMLEWGNEAHRIEAGSRGSGLSIASKLGGCWCRGCSSLPEDAKRVLTKMSAQSNTFPEGRLLSRTSIAREESVSGFKAPKDRLTPAWSHVQLLTLSWRQLPLLETYTL